MSSGVFRFDHARALKFIEGAEMNISLGKDGSAMDTSPAVLTLV